MQAFVAGLADVGDETQWRAAAYLTHLAGKLTD
jgi:hypothetical protein